MSQRTFLKALGLLAAAPLWLGASSANSQTTPGGAGCGT